MSYPPPPNDGNDYQPTAQQPAQPPPQPHPQPQYGQPAPQYGAPYTPAPPVREREFGVASIVWTLLGAIAAVVGLFAVRWTQVPARNSAANVLGTDPKFMDLRRVFNLLDQTGVPDKPEWTIAYFNYAAFLILGVTAVLAILAALPTPATGVLRVLGFILGLVGAAAALFVTKLDGDGDISDYLKGGLGLYFVAGGSLLMAIGAVIGSRRRT